MKWSKLETLHGELVLYHMITGSPKDFLNFIQVNKKFKYLLESCLEFWDSWNSANSSAIFSFTFSTKSYISI